MDTDIQNKNLAMLTTLNNTSNDNQEYYFYIGFGIIMLGLVGRCCQTLVCSNEVIEQQLLEARMDMGYDYFV